MAESLVRSMSIYAGTKKVSQQESSSYSLKDGGEAVYGDVPGGYIAYSHGAVDSAMTMTEIVPVAGTDYDFVSALLNHTPLDIALSLVDGKIHQVQMRCMDAKFDSAVQTGILKGEFQFKGGPPTLTG